jgi:predicted transcriptional regulator
VVDPDPIVHEDGDMACAIGLSPAQASAHRNTCKKTQWKIDSEKIDSEPHVFTPRTWEKVGQQYAILKTGPITGG